jgi:hypothetical protein
MKAWLWLVALLFIGVPVACGWWNFLIFLSVVAFAAGTVVAAIILFLT